MRKARLAAGILLAAGVIMAPLATASSAAAAPTASPNTPTSVPSGISAADVPGASVFGDTDPSTPETVSFILKMRSEASLSAAVEQGIPTSQYLSVGQFAARHGQPVSNIDALTKYLAGFGISTTVYADDLDVVANGTAGEFNKALTITEKQVEVPPQPGNAQYGFSHKSQYYSNISDPLLPYRLASFVTAILGLSNYGPYVSDVAKPASEDKAQQGSNSACVAEFGLTNGCHLPQDFARMYDLNPLYARANGTGQTIGIVTLAAVDSGPAILLVHHLAHQSHRHPHRRQHRRRPRRAERRLRHGRDRPGHRAVRGARPRRQHHRLPGAEH